MSGRAAVRTGQKLERVKVHRHFAGQPETESDESENEEALFFGKQNIEPKPQTQKIIQNIKLKEEKKQISSSSSSSEDEEFVNRRRKRLNQLQTETSSSITIKEPILESSDEESDEEEEEEMKDEVWEKPLFIPKTHRGTIFEKEKFEQEQEKIFQENEAKKEKKQTETKKKVEELNKKIDVNSDKDEEELINDSDDSDDEEEYEAWREREIRRVKRERNEKLEKEKERKEIERRRNLTDYERRKEDEEEQEVSREKKEWKYMQKYYKQGVFYQDLKEKEGDQFGEVLKRDYASAPTAEDKLNYSILPKVMQVKNFGKKGRTKYTDLVSEDTYKNKFHDPEERKRMEQESKKQARKIVEKEQSALKKRKY
jgi:microfibrillar-associated protein 1